MAKQKLYMNKNNLTEDRPVKIQVNNKSFVIIMHNDMVYALNAVCTHEGCSLDEGYIDGEELVCSCHSGAFDIKTGKANENTPWVTDTEQYDIEVEDYTGELFIDL